MKKFISILSLVFSMGAMAKENVTFTYSGIESWGRSFYSCDYAEYQTEMFLEIFGATEVYVTCFGGVASGSVLSPVTVRANFVAPVITDTSVVSSVDVSGDTWNPACGLNVFIVKNLLPKFSNVKVLSKSDSCAFQSSNFRYKFSVAK